MNVCLIFCPTRLLGGMYVSRFDPLQCDKKPASWLYRYGRAVSPPYHGCQLLGIAPVRGAFLFSPVLKVK